MLLLFFFLAGNLLLKAQWRWDGEGGDGKWTSASNWLPDGVPEAGASVLLDNSVVENDYTVTLPTGTGSVFLAELVVMPSPNHMIVLDLPGENIAVPALSVTGPGESLQLFAGAVFRNASGAGSGEPIQLSGQMRLGNGARYIHQTNRGNASLIDKLSVSSGTEEGVFEFDVPGTAGYTVSLTGNVFGSLEFKAAAAGGIKSYSGSGSSILQVRGNLMIHPGASLTSTLSANILLQGNLHVDGTFQLHPATSGTTGRSVFFTGKEKKVSGSGVIRMNTQFRNLEFFSGSSYQLERDLELPLSSHQLMVHTDALLKLGTHKILGAGSFVLDQQATLGIGHPDGITNSDAAGNIQTAARSYGAGALYFFEGDGPQHTGDGLPPEIHGLGIRKTSGNLYLDQSLKITGVLHLLSGKLLPGNNAPLRMGAISILSAPNDYGQPNQGWQGSYVEGELTWESAGMDSMVLPIGKAGVFAPVKIIRTNEGPAAFRAAYEPSPHPASTPIAKPPLDHISRMEHWTILLPQSGAEASIALSWRPSSGVGSGAPDINSLRIAQWEDRGLGLRWEELGSNPAVRPSAGFGWITSNTPSNFFSAYTLASATPANALPFRQLHLSASWEKAGLELEAIAEGTGILKELVLEKQGNNGQFFAIGQPVYGPAYQMPYTWVDSAQGALTRFYRARAISADGVSYFSRVLPVERPSWQGIRLFPNPASEKITLVFPGLRSGTSALIVQANGKRVRALELEGEIHQENILNLPAGHYFLWVLQPAGVEVIPFVKY